MPDLLIVLLAMKSGNAPFYSCHVPLLPNSKLEQISVVVSSFQEVLHHNYYCKLKARNFTGFQYHEKLPKSYFVFNCYSRNKSVSKGISLHNKKGMHMKTNKLFWIPAQTAIGWFKPHLPRGLVPLSRCLGNDFQMLISTEE